MKKLKKNMYLFMITLFIVKYFTVTAYSEVLINHMKGFYWMVGTGLMLSVDNNKFNNFLNRTEYILRENQALSGIVITVKWNDIEKSDNRYDFKRLDRVIELAIKNNKFYKLDILPGVNTPEWVYNKGGQVFYTKVNNPNRKNYNDNIKIPIPWDNVYQKYFYRFINEVSHKYKNDKFFISITVTGVNFLSSELHLPKRKEDMEKWKKYSDYKNKIASALKKSIDFFAQKFPNQQLCLHITLPLEKMHNEVEKIIEYGITKYPDRFTIQSCQLHGRNDNSKVFSYQVIMKYKDKIHNGFQSLSGWKYKKSAKRMGSMEMAVLNFLRADGEYWELWKGDGGTIEIFNKLNTIFNDAKKKWISEEVIEKN